MLFRAAARPEEPSLPELMPQMHPTSPRAATYLSPRPSAISRSVSDVSTNPSAAARAAGHSEGTTGANAPGAVALGVTAPGVEGLTGPLTPEEVAPVAPSGNSVDHQYERLQKENSNLSQQ